MSSVRERFEVSVLGGAFERRYRKMRPDVARLPWQTLVPADYPPPLVERARRFWTSAAFQEHRTGAACGAAIEALIAARAPIDLVAILSRFVLDEVAHVELCARVASAFGGALLEHDPNALFVKPAADRAAIERATELVVRVFCVGEAFSVPMQRATAKATQQPLLRAVIQRIAKDEAAHGRFGWVFLDWAEPQIGRAHRAHLASVARQAVREFEQGWEHQVRSHDDEETLGWLPGPAYRALAERTMTEVVIEPLRARDLF